MPRFSFPPKFHSASAVPSPSCDSQSCTLESLPPNDLSPPSPCVPSIQSHSPVAAWAIVFGVWINQFSSFGYINAFGVYNDFYVRQYLVDRYTSAEIGWIGGVQIFLALSTGLVTGRAHDNGYFSHLMIGGTLLSVFSLFMLSLSTEYYQIFLTQAVGSGIGIGMTYVPSLALIAQYFDKDRSLATGIALTGAAAGGAVHPILLNKWFHGSLGFQNGVRASAGLVAGLSSLSLILMRNKIPQKSRETERSFIQDTQTYMREPAYCFMVLGAFMVLLGMFEPSFFIQLSTIKNNIDEGLAFYTIAIMNGCSIFGRIFPTLLINRYGAFNLEILFTLICATIIFSSIAIYDVLGTVTFSVMFGLFQGGYVGILAPMITSLAKDDSEVGSRLGVCFSLTASAALFGMPISGFLLGPDFAWWRPSFFAGLAFVIGACFFGVSRFLLGRQKGTQRV